MTFSTLDTPVMNNNDSLDELPRQRLFLLSSLSLSFLPLLFFLHGTVSVAVALPFGVGWLFPLRGVECVVKRPLVRVNGFNGVGEVLHGVRGGV